MEDKPSLFSLLRDIVEPQFYSLFLYKQPPLYDGILNFFLAMSSCGQMTRKFEDLR